MDITWEERQQAKMALLCLFQDLCTSTLHGQEKYSSELSKYIVTWDAGGGGMGVGSQEGEEQDRGKEKEGNAGREFRGERDSGKCTQSILLLRLSQIGGGIAILIPICSCCFVGLGFASGHGQYGIYMQKIVREFR